MSGSRRRWLRPRRAALPAFFALWTAWWWPAFFAAAPRTASACRPPYCLHRLPRTLGLAVAVGLPVTWTLAAGLTALLERHTDVIDGRPGLFRPGRGVAAVALACAAATATLVALAAFRLLFTPALAWLTYTLAVPVFDAALLAAVATGSQSGTAFQSASLALYAGAVAGQVAWWYGAGRLAAWAYSTLTGRISGYPSSMAISATTSTPS